MFYIHSDLRFATDKQIDLRSNLNYLKSIFGKPLIFPVYNYEYSKSRVFNVYNDISQLGQMNEFIRNEKEYERTIFPVFSDCYHKSIKFNQDINLELTPFSNDSFFSFLSKNDGKIVHYGSNLRSTTYIHYLEDKFFNGKVPYRYQKKFPGKVIIGNDTIKVKCRFHVCPAGLKLRYNVDAIFQHMIKYKLVELIQGKKSRIFWFNVNEFENVVFSFLQKDPFALLDDDSKVVAKQICNNLGREVLYTDFE